MNEQVQADVSKDVWNGLETKWLKINCDGTFNNKSKKDGFAIVVRDCEGRVVGEDGGIIKVDSALTAEAVACRAGVLLAVKKKYNRVVF